MAHRPDQPRRGRRNLAIILAILAFAVIVLVIGLIGAGSLFSGFTSPATTTTTYNPLGSYAGQVDRAVSNAIKDLGAPIPTRPGQSAPTGLPPSISGVGEHEVVGFIPGYELAHNGKIDYSAYSELVFSSIAVLENGALDTASLGYQEISYGDATSLIQGSHADGVPVLLSIAQANQSVIDAITGQPGVAAGRLASQVAPILSSNGFDGLDLDIEGTNVGDRAGFTRFVNLLSADLRAKNSTWSLMVNSYPDSAMGQENFFDVQAIARVAQLFVMAYDMTDLQIPSATAPLTNAPLSDGTVLASYAAEGLASKAILGIPFYGYDFTASRAAVPADALGSPFSVTYNDVVAAGHKAIWDPTTETPYTPFYRQGHWHQTWFEDPLSVALKTALAWQFHFAGVGAWEVGMASGHPEMTAALSDGAAVAHLPLARQSSAG